MASTTETIPTTEIETVNGNAREIQVGSSGNPTNILKLSSDGSIKRELITSEDQARYDKILKSIDTKDINSTLNYGSELQSQTNRASNSLISSVRTCDVNDELGGYIDTLLAEIGTINVDELKPKKGLLGTLSRFPIIRKLITNVEKVWKKYDSIEKNIDEIANKILATRLMSLTVNNALQKEFQNNIEYAKIIEDHIIAGKIKLEELNRELDIMMANPTKYETWEITDMQDFIHNFDRRISDLVIMHHIFKESLPKIRLIQNNNIQTANKAQSIVSTTLPIWKSELAMAVALTKQRKAIDIQRKVADTTNQIIKKNADLLHQNSIDIARENERGVVDLETLRYSTQKIIETIRDCKEIHNQGVKQRREIEAEIVKLDTELQSAIQAQTLSHNSNNLLR